MELLMRIAQVASDGHLRGIEVLLSWILIIGINIWPAEEISHF